MNLNHIIIFIFLSVKQNLSAQNIDIKKLLPPNYVSFDMVYCNSVDSFYRSDTIDLRKEIPPNYNECGGLTFLFFSKDSCFLQLRFPVLPRVKKNTSKDVVYEGIGKLIDALSFKAYTKKRKTYLKITSINKMTSDNFLVLTPKLIKSNNFENIQTLRLLRVK